MYINYLNTKYIIERKNKQKIIIFDSCYFEFYYPDLKYVRYNNKLIEIPATYHYQYMIDNYLNNASIDNYIEKYVNNKDLISKEKLLNMANDSINILKNKYNDNIEKYVNFKNVYIIGTAKFIENNYKNKLLFYSMNHPSKYLLNYICDNIVKILNISNNINYDLDPLKVYRGILYKCIQSVVKFNVNNDNLFINKNTDLTKAIELYYNTYDEIELKKLI